MNILKKEKPVRKKMSKNMKRFKAVLGEGFLEEIIKDI